MPKGSERSARPPLPLPYPHFMAFAPLDCWARLLLLPPAWIPLQYWPRLAFALFVSFWATLGTLPERLILAPILHLRARRDHDILNHPPGSLIVLGYFRSGTTHLHYLLSCDPRFRTPTWSQALCPQGFCFSWAFLRVFMIPFLSAKRPQDDVAIGPDWPAEDDFALNNWACASSLIGRFVLPRAHSFYERFHALSRLTPRELARWRRLQYAFLRKLAWLSPSRAILLKSPSHTARVAELARMLPRARFVHIARDPAAVIKSNINMADRLGGFNLQDPPHTSETRARVVSEYLDSEDVYLRDSAALPSGSLVEIRYEDLVADPIATIERIYRELNLTLSDDARQRMLAYLTTVRDYRAANQRDDRAAAARATTELAPASAPVPDATGGSPREPGRVLESPFSSVSSSPSRSLCVSAVNPSSESSRIASLISRFHHDQPAIPKVVPPAVSLGGSRSRTSLAALLILALALLALPAWLAIAYYGHDRHDALTWPLGALLGYVAIRTAREGSPRLGLYAAFLTLAVYTLMVLPGSFLADYAHRGHEYATSGRPNGYIALANQPRALWNLSPWIPMKQWEWYHITKSARVGALAWNNLFWLFMGLMSAYRFASRPRLNPPGRG